MSAFDWLFRRNRKTESEPLVPPPAPRTEAKPQAVAPAAPAAPVADPYGSDFLPITRDEIVDASKKGNLLSTAFQFGRPSIIPPVTDPRTQLIDRALVTNGLLSSDRNSRSLSWEPSHSAQYEGELPEVHFFPGSIA